MTILALDLAKSKSVFCNFDTVTGEVTFGDVATKRADFRELLERVRPAWVVIEICPLAGWVHDLVRALNIEIQVADPTQDAWKWQNVKRKTDEDDALSPPIPVEREIERRKLHEGVRLLCQNG